MADQVALVWGGPIKYNFGPSHPLQPVRVELAVELMRAYGLLDRPNVRLIPPRLATDEELQLIHSADYIAAIRKAGASGNCWSSVPEYCLGPGDNPIFPEMHTASAQVVGGSIDAAEFVMAGSDHHAFSIAGGLHHAMRGNASGFCIYNDASIAIEHMRRKFCSRVLYLDTDAHHGDGVQAAFYDTAEVLTISFHESGRFLFPGTGFVNESGSGAGKGYSVNVPLPPGAGDDVYGSAFDAIV
ncbi:MAG: acetoin utilization protein AcuC, partial [Chloroflexota bacterium]